MTQKPIIAIDGPAASGKGTLARKIAENLGYAYMDTGKLYRAVGFEALKSGGDPGNEGVAVNAARLLMRKIHSSVSPREILHNPILQEDDIAAAASKVAAVDIVRDMLLDLQRSFAESPGNAYKGAVLDGRDIGTVVCPQADVKLYVTASPEIRAGRRLKELQSKGIAATYEAVLEDMRARDARDAQRKTAPMKPADDAVTIDSTSLGPEEALETALAVIAEKLSRQ